MRVYCAGARMFVSRSIGLSVDALGFEDGASVDVIMGMKYGAKGMKVRVCRER